MGFLRLCELNGIMVGEKLMGMLEFGFDSEDFYL